MNHGHQLSSLKVREQTLASAPSFEGEMVAVASLTATVAETSKLLEDTHQRIGPILDTLGRGQLKCDENKSPSPQNLPELARHNLHLLYLLQEKLSAIGAALGA